MAGKLIAVSILLQRFRSLHLVHFFSSLLPVDAVVMFFLYVRKVCLSALPVYLVVTCRPRVTKEAIKLNNKIISNISSLDSTKTQQTTQKDASHYFLTYNSSEQR